MKRGCDILCNTSLVMFIIVVLVFSFGLGALVYECQYTLRYFSFDDTYSCSLFACTVRGGNLCPFTLPNGRTREQTKYGIMIFVSVEPAYFSIFNFKMILPIFVLRMATHCVKYRLYAFVCIQFHPG